MALTTSLRGIERPALRDGRARRARFLLAAVAVAAGTLGAAAHGLWRLLDDALAAHRDMAGIYARAFESHLSHTLNVVVLTMEKASEQVAPAIDLGDALKHAPYLRSIAVTDLEGRIIASAPAGDVGHTVPPQDFLPRLADGRRILQVAPPWTGRDFAGGRPATEGNPAPSDAPSLLPLRLPRAGNGAFDALAALNPDYFLHFYQSNLAKEPGIVDVLRLDGTLLLSTDPTRLPGTRPLAPKIFDGIVAREIGTTDEAVAGSYLSAFRTSGTYPLMVLVHLDRTHVVEDWRDDVARTGSGILIALVTALALASLYYVRLQRRARQHDADLEKLRVRSAALEAAANAILITDVDGRIVWVNRAFCSMSGYGPEEALGRNPRDLLKSGLNPPEDYRDLWTTILAGRVWRGELVNRRRDGTHFLEDQTITPVRDDGGAIRHFIAVKQDITERRRNEEHMAALSRHLVVVQESARRRLSGELHDRTSPNLAAISINLDMIAAAAQQGAREDLSHRIEDVRALIDDTTASLREVCSELRPPVLDHGGLCEALDTYVRQFHRRTGIAVEFNCGRRDARFDPAVETTLYRIAQEALTNCAKHAQAVHVRIDLDPGPRACTLTVADDGRGFAPATVGRTTHTSGLGMLTMREMAEISGGTLVVRSSPGNGTTITATIPNTGGPPCPVES